MKFGVRTLLFFLLYLSCCFAVASSKLTWKRSEERSLNTISALLSAPVHYNRGYGYTLPMPFVGDVQYLDCLILTDAIIRDDDLDEVLRELRNLTHLRNLYLAKNGISAKGIGRLKRELPGDVHVIVDGMPNSIKTKSTTVNAIAREIEE